MRKNTVAPKKPSATNAKFRASTSPTRDEDANLSPIKEEDMTMPEVQGSSDNKSLTMEDMEPLSAQQTEFLNSCLDDTRNRLEAEQREERKFYEQSISEMRAETNAMREDYNDLQRSRSSSVIENPIPKLRGLLS
jgi:hypothetical protein